MYKRQALPWAWIFQVTWVFIPAFIAVVWGMYVLWREKSPPVAWALLLNGLFVLSLPSPSTRYFVHSSRIALGVIVALAWMVIRTQRRTYWLVAFSMALLPLLSFEVDAFY